MVAGGGTAQPPADPGRGVFPGPVSVRPAGREPRGLPGRLAAGTLHRRQRRAPVGAGRQAHHLAGPQRHPAVAVGRQVQPVRTPFPAVGQHVHRPQVHQLALAAGGDRAQVHVVHGGLAADQPDQRERAGVEPGEAARSAKRSAQPRRLPSARQVTEPLGEAIAQRRERAEAAAVPPISGIPAILPGRGA